MHSRSDERIDIRIFLRVMVFFLPYTNEFASNVNSASNHTQILRFFPGTRNLCWISIKKKKKGGRRRKAEKVICSKIKKNATSQPFWTEQKKKRRLQRSSIGIAFIKEWILTLESQRRYCYPTYFPVITLYTAVQEDNVISQFHYNPR